MKIIIVGCGKIGSTLAEQLDHEGHDITIMDNKATALHRLTDSLDVIGLVANGASYSAQLEAGIEAADLLIAVTSSDELNLLCCLIAKKAGNCQTIARVRNPDIYQEISFIKEELGLSLSINPEYATAMEMARLIRIPSAIKVDTFAKGKAELLHVKIPEGSVLEHMTIQEMSNRLSYKVLVCSVERGTDTFIPKGDFILTSNDRISILASAKNSVKFFRWIGIVTSPIKNVMIVGGSKIAAYLAQLLQQSDIAVKILELNHERCLELSALLPEASIIHCDASQTEVLVEEGIAHSDAFAALTNLDEENILLSLLVNKKSKAKIITKVSRSAFEEVLADMPLGSLVNPKAITSWGILQYVRALQNSVGSNVETLYRIGETMEALEFVVKPNDALVGIPLMKLPLKDNLLVSCIIHKGNMIIPGGKDIFQVGDVVIIVTTRTGFNDLSDILKAGR